METRFVTLKDGPLEKRLGDGEPCKANRLSARSKCQNEHTNWYSCKAAGVGKNRASKNIPHLPITFLKVRPSEHFPIDRSSRSDARILGTGPGQNAGPADGSEPLSSPAPVESCGGKKYACAPRTSSFRPARQLIWMAKTTILSFGTRRMTGNWLYDSQNGGKLALWLIKWRETSLWLIKWRVTDFMTRKMMETYKSWGN